MTTFLIDVSALIALIDPGQVHHDVAHDWFAREGRLSWATCPMAESGVLQIVGHPRYPNSPGSPVAVTQLMEKLRALPGHVFWPDDISLLDAERVDATRLLTSAQVTDSYLLALACARGGRLASFDWRLVANAVRGGAQGLHLIE